MAHSASSQAGKNPRAGNDFVSPTPMANSANQSLTTPLSSFQKCVCLEEWWLVKAESDGKRLAVGGLTSRWNQAKRVFRSSPIIKRNDAYTLETTDGITVIIQGLINRARSHENGFPPEACNKFLTGFPLNWEVYADQYLGKESVSAQTGSSHFDEISTPSADCGNSDPPVCFDELPISRVRDCFIATHESSDHDMARGDSCTKIIGNCSANPSRDSTLRSDLDVRNVIPFLMAACLLEETPSKHEMFSRDWMGDNVSGDNQCSKNTKNSGQEEYRKTILSKQPANFNHRSRGDCVDELFQGNSHKDKSNLSIDASNQCSLQTAKRIINPCKVWKDIHKETLNKHEMKKTSNLFSISESINSNEEGSCLNEKITSNSGKFGCMGIQDKLFAKESDTSNLNLGNNDDKKLKNSLKGGRDSRSFSSSGCFSLDTVNRSTAETLCNLNNSDAADVEKKIVQESYSINTSDVLHNDFEETKNCTHGDMNSPALQKGDMKKPVPPLLGVGMQKETLTGCCTSVASEVTLPTCVSEKDDAILSKWELNVLNERSSEFGVRRSSLRLKKAKKNLLEGQTTTGNVGIQKSEASTGTCVATKSSNELEKNEVSPGECAKVVPEMRGKLISTETDDRHLECGQEPRNESLNKHEMKRTSNLFRISESINSDEEGSCLDEKITSNSSKFGCTGIQDELFAKESDTSNLKLGNNDDKKLKNSLKGGRDSRSFSLWGCYSLDTVNRTAETLCNLNNSDAADVENEIVQESYSVNTSVVLHSDFEEAKNCTHGDINSPALQKGDMKKPVPPLLGVGMQKETLTGCCTSVASEVTLPTCVNEKDDAILSKWELSVLNERSSEFGVRRSTRRLKKAKNNLLEGQTTTGNVGIQRSEVSTDNCVATKSSNELEKNEVSPSECAKVVPEMMGKLISTETDDRHLECGQEPRNESLKRNLSTAKVPLKCKVQACSDVKSITPSQERGETSEGFLCTSHSRRSSSRLKHSKNKQNQDSNTKNCLHIGKREDILSNETMNIENSSSGGASDLGKIAFENRMLESSQEVVGNGQHKCGVQLDCLSSQHRVDSNVQKRLNTSVKMLKRKHKTKGFTQKTNVMHSEFPSHAYQSLITRNRAKKLSFASPESLNFKRSRSGRLLVPPLEKWRNQQIVYDPDGVITGITLGYDQTMSASGNKQRGDSAMQQKLKRR